MAAPAIAALLSMFGSGGAAAGAGGAAGSGGAGAAGMAGMGGMGGVMEKAQNAGIGGFFENAGKIKSARAPNPFTGQGGAMAVNMQGKPLNQRTGQMAEAGGEEGSAAGDMGESFGNFVRQMLRRREGGSV